MREMCVDGKTYMSVRMYPGEMPFTWTLCWLHSLLSAFVSWPRPPLAAAYAGMNIPPYTSRATDGATRATTQASYVAVVYVGPVCRRRSCADAGAI